KAVAGARWRQGRRPTPFAAAGSAATVVAETRLHKVPEEVARGLSAWSRGERDVVLLDDVPAPSFVLALQARGRRCVALLAREDGLAFAMHDVCHLEKFVEPEHHAGQRAFFARLLHATGTPQWAALGARFDDAWRTDWEHVAADMNGSPVFLMAA